MSTSQDQVDDWINKAKAVSGVVAEGVGEKFEEAGGNQFFSNMWNKTKSVTGSVVKGVSEGAKVPVDDKAARQEQQAALAAVQSPSKGIYTLALVAGAATALGVGRYLVTSEVRLRILLRAMSKDWTEDVGDGLIGPVGHMYRPFFAEIDHHLHSVATPRPKTTWQKIQNYWSATTTVTVSPTAMKQMYHGLMAVSHSLAFVVRFRYHLAHGKPNSLGGKHDASGSTVAQADAVEQFAYGAVVFLKKAVNGKFIEEKKPEKVVTRRGEEVPEVGNIAVGGSLALALWHWAQFARCYGQRGGALYAPFRQKVVAPLQKMIPAKVQKVCHVVSANLETLALLGESIAAVSGGFQLLAPSSGRHVAATAALRISTFGKLVATTHRLFDDVEHTLHNYGSQDRQMIFAASTGLALSAIMTPRACDYSGVWRTFSVISRGLGIAAFFHGRGVFSQPHSVRTTDPARNTVYDTFTLVLGCYASCFAISLAGAHHVKAQVAGLALLSGLLYGINQAVKKQEKIAGARGPKNSTGSTATAGGAESAQASARGEVKQTPREDPPSYGTATKNSPRAADGDQFPTKEPAPMPVTDSDDFQMINHSDAAVSPNVAGRATSAQSSPRGADDHDMYGGKM